MKVTRFFSILFSRESNHCFGVCGYQFAVKIILFGTCTGLVKCSGVLNRSLLLQGREQISSLFLTSIFTIQKGGAEGKGLKMLCNTLVLHSLQHLWGIKSFILFCKHNFASKEGNERGRVDRACSVGNVVSCSSVWLARRQDGDGRQRLGIKMFFALSMSKVKCLLCLWERPELTAGIYLGLEVDSSILPSWWGWSLVEPCAVQWCAKAEPSPVALPGGSAWQCQTLCVGMGFVLCCRDIPWKQLFICR